MKKYDKYKPSGIEWIGEIPEEWEPNKVKFVSKRVTKGTTPMTMGKEFTNTGVLFFKVESISDKMTIIEEMCTYIDFETHKLLSRSALQENDVLLSIAGAIGRTAIVEKKHLPANTNQALAIISPIYNNILPLWLCYSAKAKYFFTNLTLDTVKTAQSNLSLENISNSFILIPPLHEQTTIASYLDNKTSKLDSLIEKKERMIELLKEEKQAVINKAVTKGINKNVKFKDSGIEWIGEIPEHWEVIKLKYLISKVGSGITPSGGAESYVQDGIPLLRSQNIYSDGLRLSDVAFITKDTHDKMENSKVLTGDVLLNITGASIGRCYYFYGEYKEANVNQHVCIIRPILHLVTTKYLYIILSSYIGQKQIEMKQNGANREGLNFEELKNFVFPISLKEEQASIVSLIENVTSRIDKTINLAEKEIELLKEYREALISEAVTGKIKVV